MRCIIFTIVLALVWSSCTSVPDVPVQEHVSSKQLTFLTPGMTKGQALTTLGLPDSTSAPDPTTEILHYTLSTTTQSGTALRDYIVILRHGLVTKYGRPRNGTKVINGVRIYEVH